MKDHSKSSRRRSRRNFNRAMKIVRRIHLYLGLLLVPWVVLFGLSGFLFNHTTTFFGGSIETLSRIGSSGELTTKTTLDFLDLAAETDHILAAINGSSDRTYSLKGAPWLSGHLNFSGRSGKEVVTLKIDPFDGSAVATKRRPRSAQDLAEFNGQRISAGSFSADQFIQPYTEYLQGVGIPLKDTLALSERGSQAEIRFVLVDETGEEWNGSYNLAQSKLSGVSTETSSNGGFARAVTRLHKTHGYPDTIGARWIWTLLADITALSLVVWGLTGLAMWWQIQPTRAVGTIAIFVAAVAAFWIFSGTLEEHGHNPAAVRKR